MTMNGKIPPKSQKPFRIFDRTFFIVTSLVIAGLLLFCAVCHPVIVSGRSMYPTYEDGDLLSTDPFFTSEDLAYDAVVVFYEDAPYNKILIKRIVGRPSDTIQIKDGYLYRNGEKIDEGFPLMEDAGMAAQAFTLKEDEYFCLGDNRNKSMDCRICGPAALSSIRAVVKKNFSKPVRELFSSEH